MLCQISPTVFSWISSAIHPRRYRCDKGHCSRMTFSCYLTSASQYILSTLRKPYGFALCRTPDDLAYKNYPELGHICVTKPCRFDKVWRFRMQIQWARKLHPMNEATFLEVQFEKMLAKASTGTIRKWSMVVMVNDKKLSFCEFQTHTKHTDCSTSWRKVSFQGVFSTETLKESLPPWSLSCKDKT